MKIFTSSFLLISFLALSNFCSVVKAQSVHLVPVIQETETSLTRLPEPGTAVPGIVDRNWLEMGQDFAFSDGERFKLTDENLTVPNEFPLQLISDEIAIGFQQDGFQSSDVLTGLALRWDLGKQLQRVSFALEYRTIVDDFDKKKAASREILPWIPLESGHNSEAYQGVYFSELTYLPENSVGIQFRLTIFSAEEFISPPLMLDLFGVQNDTEPTYNHPAKGEEATRTATCPCPQPSFETRSSWCTSGSCTAPGSLVSTTPTHLIIHHSAGSLSPGSVSSYRAAVTGIFYYHTATLGWSDIGYNWLIDPSGGVYEGRGDLKQGAHMCGANSGTMGICVLGDFTSIQPYAGARATLVDWMAWESCDKSISALGSSFHASSGFTIPNIAGHQDGCATACPGNSFYPTLGSVRSDVQSTIDACGILSDPCPVPTGASASLTPTGVTLSWNDHPSYDNFGLQGRKVPGVFKVRASATTTRSFNLPSNTTFEWQVWANCMDGTISEPTALMSFTTLSPRNGGLMNLGESVGLDLYPNPAGNSVWLTTASNQFMVSINLRELNGRLVKSFGNFSAAEVLLPLDEIRAGLYLIEVKTEQTVLLHKLVIH